MRVIPYSSVTISYPHSISEHIMLILPVSYLLCFYQYLRFKENQFALSEFKSRVISSHTSEISPEEFGNKEK